MWLELVLLLGAARLLPLCSVCIAGAGAAALGQDEHALEGTVALAAGGHGLVFLQGQVHNSTMVRTQGACALRLALVFDFFGQMPGKLTQILVLTFSVVAGVYLDLDLLRPLDGPAA